jgi:hypothetical protein
MSETDKVDNFIPEESYLKQSAHVPNPSHNPAEKHDIVACGK